MSISKEITRLSSAKEKIKSSIEKRGAVVADNALIDTFSDAIDSAPFSIKGSFTPENDTQNFSISGLPFDPVTVYIVCNEVNDTGVDKGIIFICHGKGVRGCCSANSDNVKASSNLSENSPLADWGQDSYTLDLSRSSGVVANWFFKSGYTYEYYISGGFK